MVERKVYLAKGFTSFIVVKEARQSSCGGEQCVTGSMRKTLIHISVGSKQRKKARISKDSCDLFLPSRQIICPNSKRIGKKHSDP